MSNHSFFLALFTLAFGTMLPAQEAAGLFTKPTEKSSALSIQSLDTHISISNNRATTQLVFTFYNDRSRVLEGEFTLPLQQGQSVFGFGLDINGVLQPAVIVDAQKGRRSFEQIVREGIDPALLEKSGDNSYRATIYPIPAKGTRTVSISIEQILEEIDGAYRYSFPLNFPTPIESFTVKIESYSDQSPIIYFEDTLIPTLKTSSSYQATISSQNQAPQKQLRIDIPKTNKRKSTTIVERDLLTDSTFFHSTLLEEERHRHPTRPKRIAILWDKSYSGKNRDHNKETELLFEYLKRLPKCTVSLYTLDLTTNLQTTQKNTRLGLKIIRESISETIYDGATLFSQKDFDTIEADQILLFSDGAQTLGDSPRTKNEVPIYSISSATNVNDEFLHRISSRNGGAFINLSKLSQKQALNILRSRRSLIDNIEITEGEIEGIIHFPTPAGLCISGKLLTPQALLNIYIRTPNNTVTQYAIQLDGRNPISLQGALRRIWAREKFQTFKLDSIKSREEASAFAQKNHIVTELTSLIVLETVEDYARFRIEPPVALKEKYNLIIDREIKTKQHTESDHFEETIALFQERINWYESEFPKTPAPPPPPKPKPSPPAPSLTPPATTTRPDPTPAELDLLEYSAYLISTDPNASYENKNLVLPITQTLSGSRQGYRASSSLSGTRIRTQLRDVATPIMSTHTMEDTGSEEIDSSLTNRSGEIVLEPTTLTIPELQTLKKTATKDLIPTYIKLREKFGDDPTFFFDVSNIFHERGLSEDASRILSNVAEIRPSNPFFLRAIGRRLLELDQYELALNALEETLWKRSFEPQSHFDIASALALVGAPQEALEFYYKVVKMDPGERFESIAEIAVMEINRLATMYPGELDLSFVDKQLLYPMPMDLRVLLSWNTDDTDVDLWVTDPFGERCSYKNSDTYIGGRISEDATEGYGPEEFTIKDGVPGEYLIEADFYGSTEQGAQIPPILSIVIIQNFSRPSETRKTVTLRIEEEEVSLKIATATLH